MNQGPPASKESGDRDRGAKAIGAVISNYLGRRRRATFPPPGRRTKSRLAVHGLRPLDEKFPGAAQPYSRSSSPSRFVRCDVTDERQSRNMVAAVASPGRLPFSSRASDILVNTAGGNRAPSETPRMSPHR